MKKNILKSTALVIFAFIAFSFTTIKEKTIEIKNSTITWKGYKVPGQHEGTIQLKAGNLIFDNNKLVGGNFVMDMTSIDVTDLQGSYKDKLVGHLKSDDFFGSATHKTAALKITKVVNNGNKATVTGDLTIKGITNSITFDMTVTDNKATAFLKINRAKYDIRYGSNSFFDDLKDKAIYDEFDLNVNLMF